MTLGFNKYWTALAVVGLVQTGVLLKIVIDWQTLLNTGQEITLAVQPVDPRDLFRGDYVTLGYELSPVITSESRNGASLAALKRGQPVYVTLHPGADNGWTAGKFSAAYPADVAASDVVVKGRIQSRWNGDSAGDVHFTIRYGIESYFVPEGTGKPIEDSVRNKKIQALVAVGRDGTAALKGLVIDGERHVDPPLL